MDITDFINEFLKMFKGLFVDCFEILRNIQFLGTNLMDFMISVFVMSAVFPLLISVARNGSAKVGKVIRNTERGRSASDDDK